MDSQYPPRIEKLIRRKMASGRYESEEELLLLALKALDEQEDEDLSAIKDGLDSLDRGEKGIPLDEAFRQLRSRHGLSE